MKYENKQMRLAYYRMNGATHVFSFKEDNKYKLHMGNDDLCGWEEASFDTYKECKAYAKRWYPELTFYRGNH